VGVDFYESEAGNNILRKTRTYIPNVCFITCLASLPGWLHSLENIHVHFHGKLLVRKHSENLNTWIHEYTSLFLDVGQL
jgi:hypothetical protein